MILSELQAHGKLMCEKWHSTWLILSQTPIHSTCQTYAVCMGTQHVLHDMGTQPRLTEGAASAAPGGLEGGTALCRPRNISGEVGGLEPGRATYRMGHLHLSHALNRMMHRMAAVWYMPMYRCVSLARRHMGPGHRVMLSHDQMFMYMYMRCHRVQRISLAGDTSLLAG